MSVTYSNLDHGYLSFFAWSVLMVLVWVKEQGSLCVGGIHVNKHLTMWGGDS